MAKRYEKRRYFARMLDNDLTIFGYEDDSPYEEDHENLDDATERGYIFGEWFSAACPEGELGSTHISRLHEITKHQFEAAQRLKWRCDAFVLIEEAEELLAKIIHDQDIRLEELTKVHSMLQDFRILKG